MKSWKKMNKTKAVLEHLQQYGRIDTWTAIREYGATRLSAIIYNLRYNYELNIVSKDVENIDRYGNKSFYTEYYLVKDAENERD